MLTDSLVALVRDGEIVQWPYKLRPDAKRLHPEVSPLPGSWDQVKAAGLMGALEAIEIYPMPRPEEPPGFDVIEAPPQWDGKRLMQAWELIGEVPVPVDPTLPLPEFTINTLPMASRHRSCLVMVVDGKRGPRPCVSDGNVWRYLSDDEVVK